MTQEDEDLIVITEEEEGQRLDKILSTRLKEAGSRTYFQYLISEEKILLNGTPVKKRIKPKAGDEVEIEYILTPELELKPEHIALNIIYEDEHLLVIDKAPGMVVHPAPGHWHGTFVNALLGYCQTIEHRDTLRPGIVHRLDKDTSGLLIAAKTSTAQQSLIDMFAKRQIHKEYIAICLGNPGDCTINAPIGRHPINRKMMAVLPSGGRSALTTCHTQAFNGKLSLVRLILATGRTHQLRVHMKHHGTPILGDMVYGSVQANRHYGIERQMLHASLLRFAHPITQVQLELKTAPPRDMGAFIKILS